MPRILNRLREYASELWFALRVSRGPRAFARLVRETVLFHVVNARGGSASSRPFCVPVTLHQLQPDIWLRAGSGDVFIFYEVLKGGVYHLAGTPADRARVRCVIDCGGNIGISALYFADRYPNARIVSIEPLIENFQILQKNVAGIDRIVPVLGCVSDTDGRRYFTTDRATWGNAVSAERTDREVPAFTIATIMRDHGMSHVDILKVDVEGEEKNLFGTAGFLAHVDVVLIELHGDYGVDRFQKEVRPHGLTVKIHDPAVAARQVAAVRV